MDKFIQDANGNLLINPEYQKQLDKFEPSADSFLVTLTKFASLSLELDSSVIQNAIQTEFKELDFSTKVSKFSIFMKMYGKYVGIATGAVAAVGLFAMLRRGD